MSSPRNTKFVLSVLLETDGGAITIPVGVYDTEEQASRVSAEREFEIAAVAKCVVVAPPSGKGGWVAQMTLNDFLVKKLRITAIAHSVQAIPYDDGGPQIALPPTQKLII